MNKKIYRFSLALVSLAILSFNAGAVELLQDSFESADLSKSNADGFRWLGTNYTSVVKQDPADGPFVVYNGSTVYKIFSLSMPDGSARNWTAKTNTHSMRFSYPGGHPMAEQRFDLGKPYRDVWFRFWLRVPTNFQHGSSGGATNHKLFALWMDGYEGKGTGSTAVWEFWNDGSGGSNVALRYIAGGQNGTGHMQHKSFVSYPNDQGRWMQIVLHVVAATSPGANDGKMELWRRWQNEANFTQLHSLQNANLFATAGVPGFKTGYLMGWANAPYATFTEWLLDDFTVANTPLLTLQSPPAATTINVQ